jgi:transglutaminase-like putative cysteine protease
MQKLVKQGRKNSLIREFSTQLVSGLSPKDFYGEAETIFTFVQSNVRYVQDINDVETLYVPWNALENIINGQSVSFDCDDYAVLLASMLESIGHPCRFMAVSFAGPQDFSHVLIQTRIGENWITADATEADVAFGWEPPGITYWLQWYI